MRVKLGRSDSPYGAACPSGAATPSAVPLFGDSENLLLDRLISCWSALLALVLEQEGLPEAVRRDWRTRLVGLSFLDPDARRLLAALGAEIQPWDQHLGSAAAQLLARLRELSLLCVEYQHKNG